MHREIPMSTARKKGSESLLTECVAWNYRNKFRDGRQLEFFGISLYDVPDSLDGIFPPRTGSHGIVYDLVKVLHDILNAFTHDPLDLSGQTKNRVDGDRVRRIFGIRLAKNNCVTKVREPSQKLNKTRKTGYGALD
ncbi:hypothetical protein AVEN_71119-1 [Araneus ventricosus]|uniref:Uncharacterized protein n=1 Tax=Araneus ventricosus TaxID=182803 RepID=A0A4Y2HJK8_ARAVE|nr:hypothetical protein AVEN_71119-1 [Araneus ventricosus]